MVLDKRFAKEKSEIKSGFRAGGQKASVRWSYIGSRVTDFGVLRS